MEQEDHDILDDSKDFNEQDLSKVDEGETVMEVTSADQQVMVVPEAKVVPEANLQEIVPATGNQITSDDEEEDDDDKEE